MMNWAGLISDYAHSTNSFWLVAIFFGSFVLIGTFLYALISGLVWEIFNIGLNNLIFKLIINLKLTNLINFLKENMMNMY